MQIRRDYDTRLRRFHEAKWDEEIIYELSVPGQRGVLVPKAHSKIEAEIGDGVSVLPKNMRRKNPPDLPEVHQMRINRHYMRLSQEVLGADITPDISQGTCTMKYSPKVQEHLVARNPNIVEVHPLQDVTTIQGLLEIYYKTDLFMREISGMDGFCFHSGGGANSCFGGATLIRAYHEERGDTKRDEIITTMFSHPCDAGAPATAGYKVITLMPDKKGYPDLDALKSVLSERTAAIFVTNPEDTGIFNPRIKEYVEAAHDAGALCYYDQANVNGIMGITRAKEAGFDVIHYNLHKTFSSPHGGMGPGCGALGVKEKFKKYLPVPWVEFDGTNYYMNYNCPDSIGHLRSFFGNIHIVIRAYMWIMQMGADGIKEAAICSVLNNQYLMKKISQIPGVSIWYAEGKRRLEQCRYSWEKLKEDTGFGTEDVTKRLIDFGMEHYWMSHHPWVVPEPFTLEPCESYSKDDIDEYVAILKQISKECYETPEIIRNAPHNAPIHNIEHYYIDDFEKIAATWKQWKKRNKQ
jgi:glycine dehydrogenase subunit 2